MSLTSPVTLEKKDNSHWTREHRVIQAVLYMQKIGAPLSGTDMTDLVAILTAVDDYAKGTNTAMDSIKTNYNTWVGKPNIR